MHLQHVSESQMVNSKPIKTHNGNEQEFSIFENQHNLVWILLNFQLRQNLLPKRSFRVYIYIYIERIVKVRRNNAKTPSEKGRQ